MNKISSLPKEDFWSLQFLEGEPILFGQASEAYAIYSDHVEDLIEERIISNDSRGFLSELLEGETLGHSQKDNFIFHAFYELGEFWRSHEKSRDSILLGHWFSFQKKELLCQSFFESQKYQQPIELNWDIPAFSQYEEAFRRGKAHLKRGDCYQYNLTFPFTAQNADFDLEHFLVQLWRNKEKRGEFAGYTQVGGYGLYSNSPECLFAIKEVGESFSLRTRPIKGTLTVAPDEDWESRWQELRKCPKNEAELFMITDLLRNDLNAISEPKVKVIHKKAPLLVPGLIHSYSELEVMLSERVSLFSVLRALFPGGSITGAPKKRVMEIIKDIESGPRGFYCGSTILRTQQHFQASINIRSGVWDKSNFCLSYHAGSGVTFESTLEGEYQEMRDKHRSLTKLLTNEIN